MCVFCVCMYVCIWVFYLLLLFNETRSLMVIYLLLYKHATGEWTVAAPWSVYKNKVLRLKNISSVITRSLVEQLLQFLFVFFFLFFCECGTHIPQKLRRAFCCNYRFVFVLYIYIFFMEGKGSSPYNLIIVFIGAHHNNSHTLSSHLITSSSFHIRDRLVFNAFLILPNPYAKLLTLLFCFI